MLLFRSYLFFGFLALSTTFIGLIFVPVMGSRRLSLKVSKFWAKTNLAAAHLICGVKSRMIGAEYLKTSPAILAAKHQSMWETLKIAAELPAPAFVLKKELKKVPIFGWWCQAVGFIFVDRSAGAKALRTMLIEAKRAMDQGASHIVIFPEGTRAAPGSHVPYQPGVAALAKSLRLPVIPAAHNSGSYWKSPGPLKMPGMITLEIFPPLPVGLNRDVLTSELERIIENAVSRLEAEAVSAETASNTARKEELRPHGQ